MTPHVPKKPRVKIYLEARYRKFVRDLPQTVFYCPDCKGRGRNCERCEGFGKLTRDSVQELIARKVLRAYRSRQGKFHGAGREDINVRMLGRGRPFVFEVVGPKILDVDLDEVRDAILEYGRGRIEVTDFVPVPKSRVGEIKETKSNKRYAALVALPADVGEDEVRALVGRELDVVQRTPQRVVHRRADKERERRVEIRDAWFETVPRDLPVEKGDAVFLGIEIDCEHGTYVKEWISGEGGRSQPSLSSLLDTEAKCVALDVLDVVGSFGAAEGKRAPEFEESVSWPPPFAPVEDPWVLSST